MQTEIHVGSVYCRVQGADAAEYRPCGILRDYPVDNRKVLVQILRGAAAGEWFVCSPAYFAVNFRLHDVSNGNPAIEGIENLTSKGE